MVRSVRDELFDDMDRLSPAEKRVARALLANYPSAGLGSAAALAKQAGTSVPSVLRLLARLGMGTYANFRERLRQEVSNGLNSPVERAQRDVGVATGDPLEAAFTLRGELIRSLASTVPPPEFSAAVSAIIGAKGILLSGGFFSQFVVEIFAAQLRQLVPGVLVAHEPTGHDVGLYLEANRSTLAIIIDTRRHEKSALDTVRLAKARGCKVLVLTDETLSPAAEDADIVLPVRVDAVPFDSFVGLLALVESLVEATFRGVGQRALDRMRSWEEAASVARAVHSPDTNDG